MPILDIQLSAASYLRSVCRTLAHARSLFDPMAYDLDMHIWSENQLGDPLPGSTFVTDAVVQLAGHVLDLPMHP